MDKKFEKIEKLMEEMMKEITKDEKLVDNKKNIKKELKKIVEEFDDEEIIFASRSKCYIQGRRIVIKALLYALLKQISEKNDFDVEELTELFIDAIAMDDKFKNVNKERISIILNKINDMI